MAQRSGRPRTSWLTRNLVILTLVSLTQDAASELLYPLLPLLVTGLLTAPPVLLGVIEGTAEATAGVTKYFAGRWSDTRGRKPFIATGYGLAAVGKVLIALAFAWPTVLVGRVVDRFGKGIRSAPRDALIAASVPKEALGRAFGFHRAGDNLGAVIGPLLGLLALSMLNENLRSALWWAVIPAVISVILVMFVREPKRLRASEDEFQENQQALGPNHHLKSPLPREFWRVTIVLVVIALVNFPDVLLLLRVMDLGFSTTQVVLAYVLFNAVNTLGAYPAGALTDRWPKPYIYAVGLLAFGIGYIGLGLVHGGAAVYFCIAIYGLFPAFTDGVGKAWISGLVHDDHRGRAQGIYQGLNNASVLIAGLVAGIFWSAGTGKGEVPLMVSGTVAFIAAIGLVAHRWRTHRVTQS